MNHKLTLEVSCPENQAKDLLKAIKPEFKDTRFKRSSIKIASSKGKITFSIKADDATALSATVNSVIKLLTVYEKTIELK